MVFKKKKTVKKRKSSTVGKKTKSYKKSSSNNGNLTSTVIGGMSYGALRSYGSQLIKPFTDKLGFAGEYADNIAMGILSYAMAKGKIPFVNNFKMSRDIGKAGLTIESAFAGVDLKNQVMGSNNSINSTVDLRFS